MRAESRFCRQDGIQISLTPFLGGLDNLLQVGRGPMNDLLVLICKIIQNRVHGFGKNSAIHVGYA